VAPAILTPLLAALLASVSASLVQRRLTPAVGTRVLAIIIVGSALAVVWGATILAVGFLVEVPWIASWAGWCRDLYRSDDAVSPAFGILGLAVLVTAVSGGGRVVRRHRSATDWSTGAPLEVIPSDEPIAFAAPGRHGRIVVSTAMLDHLDRDERRVLFAHEQSHIDHRHDRYLLAAAVASAGVPLLRPVAAQLRFSTERWADEDAATVVGSRIVVARAITRAALATVDHRYRSPALAGLGVRARVEALLASDQPRPIAPALGLTVAAGVVGANIAGSTMQLHHLLAFAVHICNLS
jgi:Zn-dependent protease with chaperone function